MALSLAESIVQFVAFGIELCSIGRQIYKKSALPEAADTQTVVQLWIDKIKKAKQSQPAQSPENSGYDAICERCLEVAGELLTLLGRLKVSGKRRSWASLIAAYRTIINKDEVETLLRRFETLKLEIYIQEQLTGQVHIM
jgi:hypothetical protein